MPHKSSCDGFHKGFFIGIMQGTGVHLGIENKHVQQQGNCNATDRVWRRRLVVVLPNNRAIASPGGRYAKMCCLAGR